jgi:hypothetical protein
MKVVNGNNIKIQYISVRAGIAREKGNNDPSPLSTTRK